MNRTVVAVTFPYLIFVLWNSHFYSNAIAYKKTLLCRKSLSPRREDLQNITHATVEQRRPPQ